MFTGRNAVKIGLHCLGKMEMIGLSNAILLILSTLVLIGGIIGFAKAKSKVSLISGIVSAALLDVAFFISLNDLKTGLTAGVGITAALLIVFLIRLAKTRKFMPSGMMVAACILSLVPMVAQLLNL